MSCTERYFHVIFASEMDFKLATNHTNSKFYYELSMSRDFKFILEF